MDSFRDKVFCSVQTGFRTAGTRLLKRFSECLDEVMDVPVRSDVPFLLEDFAITVLVGRLAHAAVQLMS